MDKVQIYQELERRGELNKLPPEKQAVWAEYKRRQTPSAPAQTTGQRAWEGFKQDIADITYAPRKALSGATLGATDWALRKLGVGYDDTENRMGEISPLAKGLTKVGGFGAELGGNIGGLGGGLVKALAGKGLKGLKLATTAGGIEGGIVGGFSGDTLEDAGTNAALGLAGGLAFPVGLHYGAKGAKWVARPLTDKVTHYIGKKNLAKQLSKTDGFEDVSLGNVDDDIATRLNQVRNAENVSPVDNSSVIASSDGVKHIYEQRIAGQNYIPEDTANVVDKALFGKNLRVIKGNVPENQVIFDSANPANKVVVNKSKNTNGISVVTAMKDKSLGKKNKRLGGLPFPPYGANITSDVSTAAGSFKIPDFQPLNANSIASNMQNVNSPFSRSFIEGLADINKSTKMRNAVQSGAEELSERARVLSDQLEHRKNGMYNSSLEDALTIPELKTAKQNYNKFIVENGESLLPINDVNKFYQDNPIAKGMIEKAREINPSAFKGIKQGSLAEFDELKRLLNSESKNVMSGESASVKDAYKRAGNDLKSLMDNKFSGFRDVNTKVAAAESAQDIFESKLRKGLTKVGGATVSPFWSGLSSPIAAAGIVGSAFNPASLAFTAGGLGGKAIMRKIRRDAGRRIADGIVRTPIEVNINPNLSAGLSATALSNMF